MDTTSDPAVPCYVAVDNCSDSVGVFNATIESCCVTNNALSYYNLYPANGATASCQHCPGMSTYITICTVTISSCLIYTRIATIIVKLCAIIAGEFGN